MLDGRKRQPEMDCQVDYEKDTLSGAIKLNSASSNRVSSVTPSTSSASISSAVMDNEDDAKVIESQKNPETTDSTPTPAFRTGRWTPDEKILFLYGLRMFGKGRWKKMSIYLPQRSLVQIKSHAQKVLKRQQAGENIFRRLEENYSKIDSLVLQAARQRDALRMAGVKVHLPTSKPTKSATKKKRPHTETTRLGDSVLSGQESFLQPLVHATISAPSSDHETIAGDHESHTSDSSVLAAAALCQLSSIGGNWDRKKSSTRISGKDHQTT